MVMVMAMAMWDELSWGSGSLLVRADGQWCGDGGAAMVFVCHQAGQSEILVVTAPTFAACAQGQTCTHTLRNPFP